MLTHSTGFKNFFDGQVFWAVWLVGRRMVTRRVHSLAYLVSALSWCGHWGGGDGVSAGVGAGAGSGFGLV